MVAERGIGRRPSRATGLRIARGLVLAAVGGVAAGVAIGVGARIAMRLAALMDGRPTLFTAGGTLGILLGLTIVGLPFAGLFVPLRRRLRGSTVRKGLSFGAAMLCFPGLVFLLTSGGELVKIGFPPLNVVMFGGLFLGYGIVLSATVAWLDKRIPGPRKPSPTPLGAN